MRIALGADHKGIYLKNDIAEYLRSLGHEVKDFGTYGTRSCDYSFFARKVAKAVAAGRYDFGFLSCFTGIGMSQAANKIEGARAALCGGVDISKICEKDKQTVINDIRERVEFTRKHNNSNILVLSALDFPGDPVERGRGYGFAHELHDLFLGTKYDGGRHERRVRGMDDKYTMVGVSLLSKPEVMETEMSTGALIEKIKRFDDAGVDEIHPDVIDGKYNDGKENLKFQGYEALGSLRKCTDKPFAPHLMVLDPFKDVELYARAGCDVFVFQCEAYTRINEPKMIEKTVKKILDCKMQAGIALEPDTPIDAVLPYVDFDDLNRVLVMTVKTGRAGQNFIDQTDKIRQLAGLRKDHEFWIAVDGGINADTARKCREAGANMFYAASYIQNAKDPGFAIKSLRG